MEELYDDFYSMFYHLTKKHGMEYQDMVNTSLMNVLLVITKTRPACIIDQIRYNQTLLNELLEILLNDYCLSTIKLTDVEYLIFLTSNQVYIEQEYRRNMANVLDYCYNGPDWKNLNINRVFIRYSAVSKISGKEIYLFTTAVPEYIIQDKTIQQHISQQILSFNSVLYNLEYKISVKTIAVGAV